MTRQSGKVARSRYAVLGMLSLRPMSGYDIRQRIAESVGYFWSESYGQIYPILKRLVAERLVTRTTEGQAGERERHVYALTERGRTVLREWLLEGVAPQVERNELLLKLFFGTEVPIAATIEHVEEFRALQQALLERYEAIADELESRYPDHAGRPFWTMTVRYGMHVNRALLAWCEETVAALQKLDRSGTPGRRPKRARRA